MRLFAFCRDIFRHGWKVQSMGLLAVCVVLCGMSSVKADDLSWSFEKRLDSLEKRVEKLEHAKVTQEVTTHKANRRVRDIVIYPGSESRDMTTFNVNQLTQEGWTDYVTSEFGSNETTYFVEGKKATTKEVIEWFRGVPGTKEVQAYLEYRPNSYGVIERLELSAVRVYEPYQMRGPVGTSADGRYGAIVTPASIVTPAVQVVQPTPFMGAVFARSVQCSSGS